MNKLYPNINNGKKNKRKENTEKRLEKQKLAFNKLMSQVKDVITIKVPDRIELKVKNGFYETTRELQPAKNGADYWEYMHKSPEPAAALRETVKKINQGR